METYSEFALEYKKLSLDPPSQKRWEEIRELERRRKKAESVEPEKFYWFPFNSGDFVIQTMAFDAEEIGIYLMFKSYLTKSDYLPEDDEDKLRIARTTDKAKLKRPLSLLNVNPEGLYYCRDIAKMKGKLINKESELSEKRREAGKRGALKRWGKNDN